MKHFHSLRTLVVVMVSIALGTCAYAGNGDNSTPGGCSDTYYGCNNEGEQHDLNDPNSVFSYEQSCVWCVTDRDRAIAAVLYDELGYVPEAESGESLCGVTIITGTMALHTGFYSLLIPEPFASQVYGAVSLLLGGITLGIGMVACD